MAILYGTQSNGETLPVQVNEFGQLVAQGLDGATGPEGPEGPQGPQGPQGEPGTNGTTQPVVSTFTPSFFFSDGGTAIIEYKTQDGIIYRWGDYVEITGIIKTSNVSIIDARGSILIWGIPTLANGGSANATGVSAACLASYGFKNTPINQIRLRGNGNELALHDLDDEGEQEPMKTTMLNEGSDANPNYVVFKVWGTLVDPDTVARRKELIEKIGAKFED